MYPVKNLISQRCHGEIMIYSQRPHMNTSMQQHHFEAAHLTHHDINWWGHTCEFPVSSLWVSWDVADSMGLLVVSSGYYWGLRWLFVLLLESATSQLTHRELAGNSQVWPRQFISWLVRCAASKWCCSEVNVWGNCEYIMISPWHLCEIKFFTGHVSQIIISQYTPLFAPPSCSW